jgi:excisionase family DNA binding protein
MQNRISNEAYNRISNEAYNFKIELQLQLVRLYRAELSGDSASPPQLGQSIPTGGPVSVQASGGEYPALLLRPEEAARTLRVSRTEIFKLMRSGEIRSILIGRRRRIPVSALNDYIARKLADAGAGASAPAPGQ